MTGRRLLEDGEKRGLVTPIVHLLGEVLQTDEIEEKENEELDAISNNRRSEEGGEDARWNPYARVLAARVGPVSRCRNA